MYNLATFASSFPYPSIKIGTMVMGIVVVGVVACKGGNAGLKGEIGQSISKVIIVMLLGIN